MTAQVQECEYMVRKSCQLYWEGYRIPLSSKWPDSDIKRKVQAANSKARFAKAPRLDQRRMS